MERNGGFRWGAARRTVAAASLAALLLIAGCSSDGGSGQDAAAAPSPTPTLGAAAAWAQASCEAAFGLERVLDGVGAAIDEVPDSDIAPTVGAPGFVDARGKIQTRLGIVAGASSGLASTRAFAPPAPLREVKAELRVPIEAAGESVLTLKDSAGEVTASRTLEDLSKAGAVLERQLAETKASAERVTAVLREAAADGGPRVRAAFAQAPACAELSA